MGRVTWPRPKQTKPDPFLGVAAIVHVAFIRTLGGHHVAFTSTLGGHHVAFIRTLGGHHVAFIRTLGGHHVAFIRTLGGHNVAGLGGRGVKDGAGRWRGVGEGWGGLRRPGDRGWIRGVG